MKKSRVRLLVIAATIVAFLAIFLAVAARGPVFGPDIALVRGVRPFSYEVKSDMPGGPLCIERVYVFRKPYKQAVLDVAKELDKSHWERLYSLRDASFDKWHSEDTVHIKRALRLPGIWKPTGYWSEIYGYVSAEKPSPDPRGWITVTTYHPLTSWTLILARMRKIVRAPMKSGPVEYTDLAPELAEPMQHSLRAPDVEKDSCGVEWVTDDPWHLPRHPNVFMSG